VVAYRRNGKRVAGIIKQKVEETIWKITTAMAMLGFSSLDGEGILLTFRIQGEYFS